MSETEYIKEYLKYEFDENEKKEMAADMSRNISALQVAEDGKKAVASNFKSQIDGLNSEIRDIATKINNGYEYRNVKCEIRKDYDIQIVEYFRCDTGELVKTRKMTADDQQTGFIEQ